MSEIALYYPYIHVRDLEWLRAALLLFKQVRRMTPEPGPQAADDPLIDEFTQWREPGGPLLASAYLGAERPRRAQERLAERLRQDAKDPLFLRRFGRKATEANRRMDELGFQIHQGKLEGSLKDALRETGLAWKPMAHEPYDSHESYVELNEQVGKAVMSTLALACAAGEGLVIVGDKRSGPLHECLTGKKSAEVYDALIHGDSPMADPAEVEAREFFDLLVFITCDTGKLNAATLADLRANREPIRSLMEALAQRAKVLGAMDIGKERDERLRDEVADILRAWERDRANLDNFWRKLFGMGIGEPSAESVGEILTSAVSSTATGAVAGAVAHVSVYAAAAGITVAFLTHGVRTFSRLRQDDEASPYRYLTLMENAGVVFRADLVR